MILGLYVGLIGEAIGILRNTRLSTIAVIFYLGLAAINFVLISGWRGLPLWAWPQPSSFFLSSPTCRCTPGKSKPANALKPC